VSATLRSGRVPSGGELTGEVSVNGEPRVRVALFTTLFCSLNAVQVMGSQYVPCNQPDTPRECQPYYRGDDFAQRVAYVMQEELLFAFLSVHGADVQVASS
jgi:hypothetical protein